ncbi:MAG: hypothetical protein N2053_09255, partial [Chitinispirillaceae bacterium]|nr:hypothetical protein [Chitinispirillaceae bacterium]
AESEIPVKLKNALEREKERYDLKIREISAGYKHEIEKKEEELRYYETHYSMRKTIRFLLEKQQILDETEDRISLSLRDFLKRTELKFSSLCKQLNALSPIMILSRGYSIAKKKDGSIVRSSSQIEEEEIINLRFHIGSASAKILEIKGD